MPATPSLILFDGVCNLCTRSVTFVIRRDPHARFQFAALQSGAGRNALTNALGPDSARSMPDSLVLIVPARDAGSPPRVYVRSGAALRVARRLRFPWPILSSLLIVPAPIRDWVYDAIAQRRIRWFGTRDTCLVPTPELQSRFLVHTP